MVMVQVSVKNLSFDKRLASIVCYCLSNNFAVNSSKFKGLIALKYSENSTMLEWMLELLVGSGRNRLTKIGG